MKNSSHALFALLAICSLPLHAAQAPATLTDKTPSPSTYVLGPDDQIAIHVVDVPEITEKPQRVDPSGDLRLPMVGRIHAEGLTVEQLEAAIKKHLTQYLQDPDVSVTVREFRSRSVSVVGAVVSPGVKQLEGQQRLVEVLSAAGGLLAEAGPTVRITRNIDRGRIPLPEAVDDASGRFSTVDVDVRALLDSRAPGHNIAIEPYDIVSVPRADVVFIIGEVAKPGPVSLTSGSAALTVMEAVSSSGGVLRTGAANKARILRRVPGQETRTELPVNLQRIMQAKADDVPLQAGDILVIPDSSGKRFTTRAIEAAIQVGTMIGTYGVIR